MSEPVIGEYIRRSLDDAQQIGDLGARLVMMEAARDAEYQRAESEHAAHVETMQERDEARDEAEQWRLAAREADHRLVAHDCGEEATRFYLEAKEATAIAMVLANTLDEEHSRNTNAIGDCEDCDVCALLERASKWAR